MTVRTLNSCLIWNIKDARYKHAFLDISFVGCQNALAMLVVVLELPLVETSVRIGNLAYSFLPAFDEVSNILAAVCIFFLTAASLLVFDKISLVVTRFIECGGSLPFLLVVDPVAFILTAIMINNFPLAVVQVFAEGACVHRLIFEGISSFPITETVLPIPRIHVAASVNHSALS